MVWSSFLRGGAEDVGGGRTGDVSVRDTQGFDEPGEERMVDLGAATVVPLVVWVSVSNRAAIRPLPAVKAATVAIAPRRPTTSAVMPAIRAPIAYPLSRHSR
jgi:hypothetical protein